jgi:competence protein ComEC
LIAGYQGGFSWAVAGPDSSLGARLALWGVREIAVLIVASLMAGLATTPYAAYHFHRMAPYGVIANLFAMPVISAVSMPAGLVALLAMPFGFDAPLWRLMGVGIDWMITVATWVAHLPGAVGRVAAFGTGPLLLATAGLIVLCLLRSPLRYVGFALMLLAALWALAAPRPDVLVSAAGDVIAVRGADGRLAAVKFGGDSLSVTEWLSADADGRAANDRTVAAGFACDSDGCVAHLGDSSAVAVTRSAAGFADDCARAKLIVTLRDPPPGCAAKVLDRNQLRRGGATALSLRDDTFTMTPARREVFDRPWAKQRETPRRAAPTPARPAEIDAAPPAPDSDAEE